MTDYIDLQDEAARRDRDAWKGAPAAQPRADADDPDRLLGWKRPYASGRADERTDGRSVRFTADEVREDEASGCSCSGGACNCPDGARFTGKIAECLANGSCRHVAADEIDMDAKMYERFRSRGEIPASMSLEDFRVTYGHGPREDAEDEAREDGVPDAEDAAERLRNDQANAWRQAEPIGVPRPRPRPRPEPSSTVTEHEDSTDGDVPDADDASARLQSEQANAWRTP